MMMRLNLWNLDRNRTRISHKWCALSRIVDVICCSKIDRRIVSLPCALHFDSLSNSSTTSLNGSLFIHKIDSFRIESGIVNNNQPSRPFSTLCISQIPMAKKSRPVQEKSTSEFCRMAPNK